MRKNRVVYFENLKRTISTGTYALKRIKKGKTLREVIIP